MFNFNAQQIFVVQPRNSGGGIVSFLLSLDSSTASLNFKNISVKDKLTHWNDHILVNKDKDAHLYNFLNFGSPLHTNFITQADFCNRYIHKNHFFELDYLTEDKKNPLISAMVGEKKSIGIYFTDECIKKILALRPSTEKIDYYQKWVYANQKKLLSEFFEISTLHHFSFSDLLVKDTFIDHIKYCKELLDLDLNIDVAEKIITQWHTSINAT
jgi:hypothetical protein